MIAVRKSTYLPAVLILYCFWKSGNNEIIFSKIALTMSSRLTSTWKFHPQPYSLTEQFYLVLQLHSDLHANVLNWLYTSKCLLEIPPERPTSFSQPKIIFPLLLLCSLTPLNGTISSHQSYFLIRSLIFVRATMSQALCQKVGHRAVIQTGQVPGA